MTLRLDGSDKTIGTVMYDETAGKIAAQKDENAAGTVSLVVQGNDGTKDWYYSVPAEETTVVTKEQIQDACGISGDISLADCKIWLETTIDNIAYARMAEANSLPVTVFATKDQLMSAFTPDGNGKSSTIGKIAFGRNSKNKVQEWYILGNDDGVTGDNTVLFAADSIATSQKFNASTKTKSYDDTWGCAYTGHDPAEVWGNHYGGSDLRAALNAIARNAQYFTTAEQGLMNETTVTTRDPKAKADYTTTDKLYALTAADDIDLEYKTIKAGTNAQIVLAMSTYWSSGSYSYFWLRAPDTIDSSLAQVVRRGFYVSDVSVFFEFALVPAFNLNLSSVIFASAAQAASSENAETGTIADGTAMTLRLDGSDKTIGTVMYDETAGKIAAQKDENAAGTVSLVVQGNDGTKDWYYSVPAGGATVVTKEQIQDACGISGALSLADCKIWLETTIDNVAYATEMAEAKDLNEEVPPPTNPPTETPTNSPTGAPTNSPTETPTNSPTGAPTNSPTVTPTNSPTVTPTNPPTETPTQNPTVTVPAGGTVQTGDGKDLILPNGGTFDKDGNVEADKIISGGMTITAPEGGNLTADKDGIITIPAGGTVQIGDGQELILPNGGTVDKDGNISANSAQPTSPPDDSGQSGNDIEKRKDLSIQRATGKQKGSSGIKLTWSKWKGASGYEVYWSYCDGKKNYKKLKTVKGTAKRTCTHTKLKKDRAYKYYIATYKMKNGKKKYVAKSPVIHVAMKYEKRTNAKKITLSKTKAVLSLTGRKYKKTFQIKAKVKKENSKRNLLTHVAGLRYYTDDKKVAKVSRKGKITAKGKGKCTIYVIANNGVSKRIKVTVK